MDIWRFCLVFTLLRSLLVRSDYNTTQWTQTREKRFLIWTDSGSTKVALSMAIPVNMYDKKKWRTFNLIFNIQFQYNMPHGPLYWWNSKYWPTSRAGEGRTLVEPLLTDLTATYIYAMLETYMNNAGINGRECLQRAICENAQVYEVTGAMERIYQRLMTPEYIMEDYYKDPYNEGRRGVDCFKGYSGCPAGASIFDKFVQYV